MTKQENDKYLTLKRLGTIYQIMVFLNIILTLNIELTVTWDMFLYWVYTISIYPHNITPVASEACKVYQHLTLLSMAILSHFTIVIVQKIT